MKISIALGNKKTGAIPSFSLTPITSCNNSKSCADKCYAVKPYNRYKNTKAAWDRNFSIVRNSLSQFKREMNGWLMANRPDLFRGHVSGDFFSLEYLMAWIWVIKKNPQTTFLFYTKDYYLFKGLELPKNMVVIFSFMSGFPVPMAQAVCKEFAQAGKTIQPFAFAGNGELKQVQKDTDNAVVFCPEQATDGKGMTCRRCQLCWRLPELKRPINIYFEEH